MRIHLYLLDHAQRVLRGRRGFLGLLFLHNRHLLFVLLFYAIVHRERPFNGKDGIMYLQEEEILREPLCLSTPFQVRSVTRG